MANKEDKTLDAAVRQVFKVKCRGRGSAQSFILPYDGGISADVTLEISNGGLEMTNNCLYRSGSPFVECLFYAEGFRGVCPYCGIFPSRIDELVKTLNMERGKK